MKIAVEYQVDSEISTKWKSYLAFVYTESCLIHSSQVAGQAWNCVNVG